MDNIDAVLSYVEKNPDEDGFFDGVLNRLAIMAMMPIETFSDLPPVYWDVAFDNESMMKKWDHYEDFLNFLVSPRYPAAGHEFRWSVPY